MIRMEWVVLLLFSLAASTSAKTVSEEFKTLVNDYWSWRLQNAPEFATIIDVNTYNAEVESYSIQAFETMKSKVDSYSSRLENIDSSSLTSEEQISYAVLQDTLKTFSDGYKWRFYGPVNPVNFLEGFWTDPKSNALVGKLNTSKDFEDLTSRMAKWANEFKNMELRMREAIRQNTTNNWVSQDAVMKQIQDILVDDPVQFILFEPYNGTLQNLTAVGEDEKEMIRTNAKQAINSLLDSLRNLSAFLDVVYRDSTRQAYGVNSFKDGEAFYRACLRWHLSVDMSPEEVHEKGLEEVKRISGKMKMVMARLGHGNLTVAQFFAMLNNDSRFILKSADEVLDRYRTIIKDRIGPKLPLYFRDIPDMPVEVEAMTYDGPGGQYISGSPDGSRPGVFQANVIRLEDNPTYDMVALSLHEANPGHHLQDTYSLSSKTLPVFRKAADYSKYFAVPYHFPFYTAYTEGWALYAESLGEELDIYKDDYELMGRYGSEIFRACRLVVDSGLHHYNWSREQAIEYMLNYTAYTRDALTIEVDRYITWPGQACAYKIGELKIRELRDKAKNILGDRFNITDFHFVLLNNGAVPLGVLEDLVDAWIVTATEANKRLNDLMKDYWEWRIKDSPDFATSSGVNKYNDRLESMNHTLNSERLKNVREYLVKLLDIPRNELSSDNRISRDVLENVLQTYINGSEWQGYGASNPFNFIEGLQKNPSGFHSGFPFNTRGDFTNYARRLELLPQQYDEQMELARIAISTGTTNNNVSMTRITTQFDDMIVDNIMESEFFIPFNNSAGNVFSGDPAAFDDMKQRMINVTTTLNEKLKYVREFLVNEYMPATRQSLGVGGLPRGLEYYQACLKWHTSLDKTADDVHQIGMQEVERITGNMRQAMKRLGVPEQTTIREFYEQMQNNVSFLIQDPEETLDRFREIIFHRIQPELSKYFKHIPGLPLVVQNSASDGISGEYFSGSADGTVPGIFFANVRRPEDNPTYSMVSLSLHEALPGHHLADSYGLVSDLPNFRKYADWRSYSVPSFYPFFNSYVEGWALYAEYLGEEMNIYHDDYELMGRYSDEMWRACRLVIDTGIHTKKWTREMAIEYMMDRVSITRTTAEIEIDRYVTWPGQACGYKIGEMKIKELRVKAKEELGDLFDLRDYHYVVLSNGPMPLDLLEDVVDDWIQTTKSDNSQTPVTTTGPASNSNCPITNDAVSKYSTTAVIVCFSIVLLRFLAV